MFVLKCQGLDEAKINSEFEVTLLRHFHKKQLSGEEWRGVCEMEAEDKPDCVLADSLVGGFTLRLGW